MPRNRATTARPAVSRTSVGRPRPAPFPSRAAPATLRRRLVVGILVVLSLALITVSFRSPDSGRLHGVQSGVATVLRPFEVGAERVARPFRDLYGWFASLFDAKSENERLRAQVDDLRQRGPRPARHRALPGRLPAGERPRDR